MQVISQIIYQNLTSTGKQPGLAISALVYASTNEEATNKGFVNMVRNDVLNLSPVRDITVEQGIGKLIKVLSDKI